MKIRNFLKTVATKTLSEEVEKELKKKDPKVEEANAILNDNTTRTTDDTKSK